ncbi:MAG: AAA family ATPase, partial [Nitrospirae bacterium]|nr:AAA family ATPase [Nitrospirota bacterium]
MLDHGRKHPLTWVAGPPGAGKTTLLASYLSARKLPALWVQIDSGDADPAAFFHYLGLAVARAAPRFRRPMPKLTPEYLAGVPTFTRNFFRELARRLNKPCVLVFDNLQEVDPSAPLYEILREGLTELPPPLRSILISRNKPPPAFARMHVSGRLAQLDWDALRLRRVESAQFARFLGRGAAALPTATSAHLHEQCEGWIAGLILLIEGAQTATSARHAFDSATAQNLFDYFAAEVFARRHPAVKEFLMQTALFPGFTAAMAERMSGNPRAAAWLDDLVRSHHFTERRGEPDAGYQYHPLFRAFLLARAREAWGPAELAGRSHRAATLLEEAGRG